MFRTKVRILAVCSLAATCFAAEETAIELTEPLGVNWSGEWIERSVDMPSGDPAVLAVLNAEGQSVPASLRREGNRLRVFFQAALKAKSKAVYNIGPRPETVTNWTPVRVEGLRVSNGLLTLDFTQPLPLPAIEGLATVSKWPAICEVKSVDDTWEEKGPARVVLTRTFSFADPQQRYRITWDIRANDPYVAVKDEYALGRGSVITLDCSGMNATRVFHPHAYNARTYKPNPEVEDSTLEPEQHPIATLGPIWCDIWYGGGPLACIYREGDSLGLGVAAVHGSAWDAPAGISLESQNLQIHGDRDREGQVRLVLPTDGGVRYWALAIGDSKMVRKSLADRIRRRVELPLDTILRDWILDWPSAATNYNYTAHALYFGGCFNEHFKAPTTYPRRVPVGFPKQGPVKSPGMAAIAYIFMNPDYWPGQSYKWRIGNPNFDTEMYMIVFNVGLFMPDHPHAKKWIEFGLRNLKGQIDNDSFPGGSWKESLGYSGAFFGIARNAHKARVAGIADPFRDWPRLKEIATWFACMHTPYDPRYGQRQIAPLGDTGPGNYVRNLNEMADYFDASDPAFAAKLRQFPKGGPGAMDIGGRPFPGFGATMRGNAYDDRHESFVTIKAGPARNHYQGDELSFFFAGLGRPLAIDYACHYSPRPWHAAMHNRPDMDDLRPVAIGQPRAFSSNAVADVFVAEERTWDMNEVPLEPHNTDRPGWEYPTSHLAEKTPWTFRRYAMLVKHDPAKSPIADYLVVRDEIEAPRPVWWNLHILSRSIQGEAPVFTFPGQMDVDLKVHVLSPAPKAEQRRVWGWKNATSTWRKNIHGEEYEKMFFGAYLPEDLVHGSWCTNRASQIAKEYENSGEMAHWLRLKAEAGRSDWLVVLTPYLKGGKAPTVERLGPESARVSLDGASEVVHLGTGGRVQAGVERDGVLTTLIPAVKVNPFTEAQFPPFPTGIDKGGR